MRQREEEEDRVHLGARRATSPSELGCSRLDRIGNEEGGNIIVSQSQKKRSKRKHNTRMKAKDFEERKGWGGKMKVLQRKPSMGQKNQII